MNLNDMKISTRLTLGFACLVIMVALMSSFGLMKVKSTNQSIPTIYDDRVVPLKQLKIVADMYAVGIVDATNKVSVGILEPKAAAKEVSTSLGTAETQWKAYISTTLTDEEKRGVAQATSLLTTAQPVVAQAEAAMESGDQDKVPAMPKPI